MHPDQLKPKSYLKLIKKYTFSEGEQFTLIVHLPHVIAGPLNKTMEVAISKCRYFYSSETIFLWNNHPLKSVSGRPGSISDGWNRIDTTESFSRMRKNNLMHLKLVGNQEIHWTATHLLRNGDSYLLHVPCTLLFRCSMST